MQRKTVDLSTVGSPLLAGFLVFGPYLLHGRAQSAVAFDIEGVSPCRFNGISGHMARARRLLQEQLRRVDAVIELCDARLPFSSRKPPTCRRLPGARAACWCSTRRTWPTRPLRRAGCGVSPPKGQPAFAYNAARGRAQEAVRRIDAMTADKVARQAARGVRKTVRAMVVGVPNVGKSTFINRLKRHARGAGRRPGPASRAPTAGCASLPIWNCWTRPACSGRGWTMRWLRSGWPGWAPSATKSSTARRWRFRCGSPAGNAPPGRPEPLPDRRDAGLRGRRCWRRYAAGRGFLMGGGACDVARAASVVLDEFRAGRPRPHHPWRRRSPKSRARTQEARHEKNGCGAAG